MKSDSQAIEALPIGEIEPNHWNRKAFAPEPLQQLADSIAAQGIIEPLIVRPMPKDRFVVEPGTRGKEPGWFVIDKTKSSLHGPRFFATEAEAQKVLPKWEIIAGERRWRAASLAKLASVPAIVRQADERTAREIHAIENLQRADLSPLEEAANYQQLLFTLGCKVEDLEGRLGRKRSHIFSRLRLLRLAAPIQKALTEGQLEGSTANLLASIPEPKKQEQALRDILNGGEYLGWKNGESTRAAMSFRKAKEWIEEKYRKPLKGALFELAQKVEGFPICQACPNRTGNLPDLEEGANANVCTDPGCFARKDAAVREVKLATFREQGFEVLPPAQAAKVIKLDWEGKTNLGYGSEYVRASDVIDGDKKERTFGAVLKDIKPIVGLNPKGAAIKLFKKTAIAPALKAAGIELDQRERDRYGCRKPTPAEQAKHAREEKITARLNTKCGQAVARLAMAGFSEKVQREVLGTFVAGAYFSRDFGEPGMQTLGLEERDNGAWWSKAPLNRLWGAAALLILDNRDDFEEDLPPLGLDLDKLEKEATAEVDAEIAATKPAPAPASKAAPKAQAAKPSKKKVTKAKK